MIEEHDIPLGDQGLTPGATKEEGAGASDQVREVRDDFTYASNKLRRQREEEQSDLRFADVDEWSEEGRRAREGEITEEGLAYAKPTRQLHAADPGIQMALEDARAARLAIKLVSRGTKPSQTTRYLELYLDQIQRESGAQDIRMEAVERMLKCGFGCYKLSVRYAEKNPPLDAAVFDQEPFVEHVRDQATCLWDPDANMIDKSDGRFWIQTFLMPLKTREGNWPDIPVTADGSFFDDPTVQSDWYESGDDGQNRHVRIAYYYYRRNTRKLILFHPEHGNPVYEDQAPDELKKLAKAKDPRVRRRYAVDTTIMRRVVDGHNLLEEAQWAGNSHPFIPVFGRHSFVEGCDRYRGVISFVREHCEALNMMFSTAVQAVSQPLSWVMGDEMGDELEQIWDLLWKNPRVRLPYRVQVEAGNLVPPPQPVALVASIEHLVMLIQQTRDLISHMTGLPQFTTNANAPRERSAASTGEIGEQGSRLYSVYIQQWATISMLLEGRGLIDLIAKLMDRPGRRLRLRTRDGKEAEIVIKQPFYHDAEGNAVPVPHADCGGTGFLTDALGVQTVDPGCEGTGVAPRGEAPPAVENFKVQYVDFSEVQDVIDITVGRQEDSAKRERVQAMSLLAGAAPDYVAYYIDQFFRDLGLNELADRIGRQLPQTQDDVESAISPLAKQMLAEKDAELAAATDALQQSQEFIRTEQVKAISDLAKTREKGQSDIERERVRSEGRLQEIFAKNVADLGLEEFKGDVAQQLENIRATVDLLKTTLKIGSDERVAGAQLAEQGREADMQAGLDAAKLAEQGREADMASGNKAIDSEVKRQQGEGQLRAAAASRQSGERQAAADRGSRERQATQDRAAKQRQADQDRAAGAVTKGAELAEKRRQADLTAKNKPGKDSKQSG